MRARVARWVAYASLLVSAFATSTSCAPPPLPPQDGSRVVTPVPSKTPEACVRAFWALADSGDDLGASAYVSESRRATFVEASRSFAETELARGRLRDALTRHFGPSAGASIHPMVEPNEPRERARRLTIRSVRVEKNDAWIQATSGGGSRVASNIEALHLIYERGGWFVDDSRLGLSLNGAQAQEEDDIAIRRRSRRGIEALIVDLDGGKLGQTEAIQRYTAIVQAEIDQDAIAGGIVHQIDGSQMGGVPIIGNNTGSLSTDDYFRARLNLAQACGNMRWTNLVNALDAWFPGDLFSLPRASATLGNIERGHEEVIIDWRSPSSEPLGRITYPLQKRGEHGDWVILAADDDPVLAIRRQPTLGRAASVLSDVTPRLEALGFDVVYKHATEDHVMERLTALHDRVAGSLQVIARERAEAWTAWRRHAAPEMR